MREPGKFYHCCLDLSAPAKEWSRRLGLSMSEFEALRQACRGKGYQAIPLCNNPDERGHCAGHADDEEARQ